jgi:hypothetical protein
LDEVFVTIHGSRDQDGNILDILVQRRRDKTAAKKFSRKLLNGCRYVPRVIVTDRLKSYAAAQREMLPGVEHRQHRYRNKGHPQGQRASGAGFLAVVGMGNGRAQAGVQSPHVHNDLTVMHPAHRLGRHLEVAGVLNVDDERVSLRHEAADGAERLAALFGIYLEPNFDGALLWHGGSS